MAILSQSIALAGDSFYDLSHVIVVLISIAGIQMASRLPTKKMTYGLRRLESLAPAVNAVILAMVAVGLLIEGGHRLTSRPEVTALPILIVSSVRLAQRGCLGRNFHRLSGSSFGLIYSLENRILSYGRNSS